MALGVLQEYERKEFLIVELQRFYDENGRVPNARDMNAKNGYPGGWEYQKRFITWNNALIKAGFRVNNKHQAGTLNGTEVCSYCGKRADEIDGFRAWLYYDNERYCEKHGVKINGKLLNYVMGNLNVNSGTGRGRAGEILVIKTLGIGNEYDCNRISCHSKIDLYNEEYGKIDVKTSLFNTLWQFGFNAKKEADTYICIGLSSNGSEVRHIWIVPNTGKIRDLKGLGIYDTFVSLFSRKHWEVDSKPYSDVWQEMIVNYQKGECKIFK